MGRYGYARAMGFGVELAFVGVLGPQWDGSQCFQLAESHGAVFFFVFFFHFFASLSL